MFVCVWVSLLGLSAVTLVSFCSLKHLLDLRRCKIKKKDPLSSETTEISVILRVEKSYSSFIQLEDVHKSQEHFRKVVAKSEQGGKKYCDPLFF